MSFLISDSLVGLVDEKSLSGGVDTLGHVLLEGSSYVIDAFIADQKTLRLHIIAPQHVALGVFADMNKTAKISLGDHKISGQILQIGWDDTDRGGRVVLCVTRKIDNR